MEKSRNDAGAPAAPNVHLWSRDGFVGKNAIAIRPEYTPTYVSAVGAHLPRRMNLFDIPADDAKASGAIATPILTSRGGLQLSVSRRRAAMPFVFRNAEADELHFIQSGRVKYETDFGGLEAGPLDFVCIPRSISYRTKPLTDDTLTVMLESPAPLNFDTPAPFGMINFGANVVYAKIEGEPVQHEGTHSLLIKYGDEVSRYEMARDPIQAVRQVGGSTPVWSLNLAKITPISYGDHGGPPAQFLSTADTAVMLYTLSARPGRRPPIHHNADYDEIILYAAGPGAWGKINQPGTLAWVPKGVTHHGPIENVPEGYQAWLLEVRPTMRLAPSAENSAALMETSEYGIHSQP